MTVTKSGEMRLYMSLRPGSKATLSDHFNAQVRPLSRLNYRDSSGGPRLAQTRHALVHRTCLLSGVKRTCPSALQMSAFDPKRTLLPVRSARYIIIAAAVVLCAVGLFYAADHK